MEEQKNIFIVFILNLSFALFEFIGGIFTNSIAIISDAIHDLGDACSIGISYFLEKMSKKKPNQYYTYGYIRYSVLGALITTIILMSGSLLVIYNSIKRIIAPEDLNYDGMIVIALIGFIVNLSASYFTKDGHSLNQKAVNLHLLEDILGWATILVSSILIKFTNLTIIDGLASLGVALFILISSGRNLKSIIDLFLEKVPNNIDIEEITNYLKKIPGVIEVHHIHLWSLDGTSNYATMHIVTKEKDLDSLKDKIKNKLKEKEIAHSTIETETPNEKCQDLECHVDMTINHKH